MLSCVEEFLATGLHNKAVKHKVVEMYAATKLLHLNLDLWVDKFSSLQYIGKQQLWTPISRYEISCNTTFGVS